MLEAAGLPDLGVTALTNPPETALPGVSFAVTARIKNEGAADAPASTTKFSLLNPDDNTTTDLKGVQIVPLLAPGESAWRRRPWPLPPVLPPGTYFLQACADGPGAIPEAEREQQLPEERREGHRARPCRTWW